jgi:tetratricopeptide (TPR) repeat protein
MRYHLQICKGREGEKMRLLRIALLITIVSITAVVSGILADQSSQQITPTEEILSAEDYIAQGNSLLSQGAYYAAIMEYDKALTVDPNNSSAYRQRGYARYMLEQYSAAEMDTNAALELNPNDIEALNNRANIYQAMELYAQALTDLNQLLQLKDDYAPAYNTRGLVYFAESDWQSAVDDFSHALTLDPTMVEAYYNRGLVYFMDYDWASAADDFKAVVEKGANNPIAPSAQHYLDYMNKMKSVPDFLRLLQNDHKLKQ